MLKKKPKHIVFIGHEGSISGAPVLLLNLLLLLKKSSDVRISLIVKRDGPIVRTYSQHFPVIVFKAADYGNEKNLFRKAANFFFSRIRLMQIFVKVISCDLIFSNTIVNGRFLRLLSVCNKKIITYVHELQNVIRYFVTSGDASYSLQHSRILGYPSLKVREVLHYGFNINESRLKPLSYYFPVDEKVIDDEPAINNFVSDFKERFSLKENFVVGGMGLVSKRKGTDLFIQVCEKVTQVHRDIRFCWIGAFENGVIKNEVKELIKEKNLEEHILFTGPLPHHYYNTAAFDLLFLSSREDPYPLVVLEAGFMKVPSICFENSGGITEFIAPDAGWCVSFSIDEAAETIIRLYENRNELREKGKIAYDKSLKLHANESLILQQFNEIVENI